MSKANNNSAASKENQQEEVLVQGTSESKESIESLADLAIVDSSEETKWILCSEPELIELDKWDCNFFKIQCNMIKGLISEIETLSPSKDHEGWFLLEENSKSCIKSSLICFVLLNDGYKDLTEQVGRKLQAPILRRFCNIQITNEEKCGEACFKFLKTFVNEDELNVMIHKIKAEPTTKAKFEWLESWTTNNTVTLADQLVVFIIIKSIFVCYICKFSQHLGTYFDTRLFKLKMFTEFIHVNTKQHFMFVKRLLIQMIHLLNKERVTQIVTEAVTIEKQFLAAVLSQADMEDIIKYMEHVANQILKSLHCPAHYNQHHLFDQSPIDQFDQCSIDLVGELKMFLTFLGESEESFPSDSANVDSTNEIEILGSGHILIKLGKSEYKWFENRCVFVENCIRESQEWLTYSSKDLEGWSLLEDNVKSCIKSLLICFYLSNDDYKYLTEQIGHKMEVPVLRRFYTAQLECETAHSETCLKFLNALVNKDKLNVMIDTIRADPATKAKLAWLKAWTTNNTVTLADQLVVFMVIKSIFVCSIYKISQHLGSHHPRLKVLKLFTLLINRDTKKHHFFAQRLLDRMINLLNKERVTQIITEAVTIEKQFLATVLSQGDMDDIVMYMEDVADQILEHLRCPTYYNHYHFRLNQPSTDQSFDLYSFLFFIDY